MVELSDAIIGELLEEDIGAISQQFEGMFANCIRTVQKPNVLLAGVTGAGKSSLANKIFGDMIAAVGDGVPVTKSFERFEPADKPIVIYDSRGLEDGYHVQFIEETKHFFKCIRESGQAPPPPPQRSSSASRLVHPSIIAACDPFHEKNEKRGNESVPKEKEEEEKEEVKGPLREQIHVVWYVINAASGRFEPFEARIVRELFGPVPVLFVLNKADVATSKQLHDITKTIESMHFDNCLGIHKVVSNRKNYSQSWCPVCFSDDVTYKRAWRQIICDDCEAIVEMNDSFGLDRLVQETFLLLPDLAKEAFLFCQTISMELKDLRAKEIVKYYSANIAMDIRGHALMEVGEMVGKIFVLWGWNILGSKVRTVLLEEMQSEYSSQDLVVRVAMIIADTILQRKLSRSLIACLGVIVNRPLRQLYQQLISLVEKGEPLNRDQIALNDSNSQEFADRFIKVVFEVGTDQAIEMLWDSN